MSTIVGNEPTFEELVRNLILLEYDAIAAYEATMEKLSDASLGEKIDAFRQDHLQHLDVLKQMARETSVEEPEQGDMKQMLTTGKIAMANLMGDSAILKAMKSNEDDTVTAYERAVAHPDAIDKSKAFFEKALADEQRHRAWMQQTSDAI